MSSKRPQLTPEQIALAEARKAKKAKHSLNLVDEEKGRIVERSWIQLLVDPSETSDAQKVKILTWNLLAQCLVRRELFPTSDCLKAVQREHMLYREILAQNADILCLQEVDRLDKLLPVLDNAGYSHRYASGPNKKHGCLIAFKKDIYEEVGTRLVHYDDEDVRSETGASHRGSSFRTKNIGHIIALKEVKNDRGLIVATTHLFWHPRYTYERARQAGILKRETIKFKHSINHADWPCIISGDFNFSPDDPAYSLLVGDSLLPEQEEQLKVSYVVHATVDPSISANPTSAEENEEEAADPDRTITNARPAKPSDGLLSTSELHQLFSSNSEASLKSAYDIGLRQHRESGNGEHQVVTFGDRIPILPSRQGRHEPEWTSYTHYWKLVLDYIFILDPTTYSSTITGVLAPHRTVDLEPGLPQKSVCGSDHVSLSAEIVFKRTRT